MEKQMLVLARQINEGLTITTQDGTRIQIRVIECRVGKVRLGIEAPPEVIIHRDEVQRAIDKKKGESNEQAND